MWTETWSIDRRQTDSAQRSESGTHRGKGDSARKPGPGIYTARQRFGTGARLCDADRKGVDSG